MAYRQIKLNVNPKALLEIARSKTGGMRRNLNAASPGQECWAACCGCCPDCPGNCAWQKNFFDPVPAPDGSTGDSFFRWILEIGGGIYDGNGCFSDNIEVPCRCIYPSSDPAEGETIRATECQNCGTCEVAPDGEGEGYMPGDDPVGNGFPGYKNSEYGVVSNCSNGCHCGYIDGNINSETYGQFDTACNDWPCECTWTWSAPPSGAYGLGSAGWYLGTPCPKGRGDCMHCDHPDTTCGDEGICTYQVNEAPFLTVSFVSSTCTGACTCPGVFVVPPGLTFGDIFTRPCGNYGFRNSWHMPCHG